MMHFLATALRGPIEMWLHDTLSLAVNLLSSALRCGRYAAVGLTLTALAACGGDSASSTRLASSMNASTAGHDSSSDAALPLETSGEANSAETSVSGEISRASESFKASASTVATAAATLAAGATTATGDATLAWTAPTSNVDGSHVTALIGYHIYYGQTAGAVARDFPQSIAIAGATTTSYQVTGLTVGTWYFGITADAADGTESPLSQVGSKVITAAVASAPPPTPPTPSPPSNPSATSAGSSVTGNIEGIAVNGSVDSGRGIDGNGNAYSGTLLGNSVTWSGLTFSFGKAGTSNALAAKSMPLHSGKYSTLYILGTGVNGHQPNQHFVVTYTDGTSDHFTQSLSDWFLPQNYAGETQVLAEAYRLKANGTEDKRRFYLYGYQFAINPAKTVAQLILPDNSNVVLMSYELSYVPSGAATGVNLGSAANVYGIVKDGTAVKDGGLDASGSAYSATLMGTKTTWAGYSFSFEPPGAANAASKTTVTLPSGNYSTLWMLATGVNGSQLNQAFTVNYTDGTSSVIRQSLSDWYLPQHFPGESDVLTDTYRLTSNGSPSHGNPFYVYGYSLAVNPAKTVKSLTLPATRNVVVLSLALSR